MQACILRILFSITAFDGSVDCSFRLGRQEDAHEYLVALLDAMHESYISTCRPKPSPELSKTSMIYQIFAGRIRSQVSSPDCPAQHASVTIIVKRISYKRKVPAICYIVLLACISRGM